MAVRTRLPLLLPKHLPLFKNQRLLHADALAKEPNYPPIVASLTAKSKSARQRQVEEKIENIRASPVQEKLSLVTRTQRKKFVVYPQTFARNADRWYQHFTKTAYIPGLPETFAWAAAEKPPEEGGSAAAAGIGDDAITDVRDLVTRAILLEHWQLKKRRPFLSRHQEQVVGPFLRNLVSGLTYSLGKYNPLLPLCSLGMYDVLWEV